MSPRRRGFGSAASTPHSDNSGWSQQAPPTFASDSLWSYEVGTKNSLADSRVVFNASAYYVDWKNIQQNVGLACGFQYAANLGRAKSTGVDVQVQGKVADALLLGAAFGYTDAHYTQAVSHTERGSDSCNRGIICPVRPGRCRCSAR